ncbi:MAG: hypothetical protein P0Y55_17345 [Candidatus Cohnella colombiensis]|uniref:Uncharacterized protein n=1 Tax=Candidatus Cohnella colombiensis TaxID=3121368 RepID=A0AA95EVM2_9BACL|nr:MAG: hypothetical protein P0Y55_17345 [Cohnella sp.]
MRISIKFIFVAMILLSLSACGDKIKPLSLYEYKMSAVALSGDTTKLSSDEGRAFAFFAGERHLKYYFKIPGDSIHDFDADLIAEELSGPENFSYNVSYILNLPAKLFRNIQADFGMGPFKKEMDELEASRNQALPGAFVLAFKDILTAVIGFILALIMMVFGTIIGTILHPIESITDFIPCCWGLIKTIFYAIIHLFTW